MGGDHVLINFKNWHIEFEAPTVWTCLSAEHAAIKHCKSSCWELKTLARCAILNVPVSIFLAHLAHSSQHDLLASVGETNLLAHQLQKKCFYMAKICFIFCNLSLNDCFPPFSHLSQFLFLIPPILLVLLQAPFCCCTPITASLVSFSSHLPMSFG